MTKSQRKTSTFYFLLFFVVASLQLKAASALEKLPPQAEAKIRAVLESPRLKEAYVGLSILDLGEVEGAADFPARPFVGKPFRTIFEHNAQKKFMPASNMKLFTAAIALQLLGKEKTFPTRVVKCPPTPSFPWNSFALIGDGDPSLDEKGMNDLVQQIKATGVTKIEKLTASSNAFGGEVFDAHYPFGWTLDDTLWYYGAPVRSLAFNRNQFDVTITGGEKTGDPAQLIVKPDLGDVVSQVTTGPSELATKGAELLEVERRINDLQYPMIVISGQVAPKQKISLGLAIHNPSIWAAKNLAQYLEKAGVKVESAHAADLDQVPRPPEFASAGTLVAQHDSPPLGVLLQRLLKNSDNLYAEMLLRDAAFYHDGTGGNNAGPRAHSLLKKWMIAQNIDVSALRFEDGSGLSRYNLVTPRATAELLAAINRMKEGEAIWNALPIAGVDGTLRTRMRSTLAARSVRAKTGTLSIASNLSGYVTTRDNRRLAVALYINFARNTGTARWAQDEIFAALAAAN